jgi:hypothetical protein
MPIFLLNLRNKSADGIIVASCSIVGKAIGFQGLVREFRDAQVLTEALQTADVEAGRYEPALSVIASGRASYFEIDQNQAQKLDILHTDTSE